MNYRISLDVSRIVSTERVAEYLDKDPASVAPEDVQRYARMWQDNLAGSNDGSELLANAAVSVVGLDNE